jgi:hypothetical protein
MGLSNEERIGITYHAIGKINEHANELRDYLKNDPYRYKPYERLIYLCEELWVAFIGNQVNTHHWLFGSSAGDEVNGTESVWAAALDNIFTGIRSREETEDLKSKGFYSDAIDDRHDISARMSVSGILDVLEYKEYYYVYNIFALTEELNYGVKRYHDTLSLELQNLISAIAKLQGELYLKFKSEETYASAYLLERLYTECMTGEVVRSLNYETSQFLHDYARTFKDCWQTCNLKELHLEYIEGEKTEWDKLFLFLKLIGTAFGKEYAYNVTMNFLKKHEEKISKKNYESILLKLHKKKAKEREDEKELDKIYYDGSFMKNALIHGFNFNKSKKGKKGKK